MLVAGCASEETPLFGSGAGGGGGAQTSSSTGDGGAGGAGGDAGTGGEGGAGCVPERCPGVSTFCAPIGCLGGQCYTYHPGEGLLVPDQVEGDCKKVVCDGGGGEKTLDDPMDPTPDGNECTGDSCQSDGSTAYPPNPPGTPCQNMAGICDGMGLCVNCINDSQCPIGFTCMNGTCYPP